MERRMEFFVPGWAPDNERHYLSLCHRDVVRSTASSLKKNSLCTYHKEQSLLLIPGFVRGAYVILGAS